MHLFLILDLAVLFALADRLAGGDYVTRARAAIVGRVSAWPSWAVGLITAVTGARPIVWAALALAAALAVTGQMTPYGPRLALLAIGFAGWRWDGWGTFGGSIDPKTFAQALGLLERHLLAVPAFVVAVGLVTFSPLAMLATGATMTVFAACAVAIGIELALDEGPGFDMNAVAELARGLGLGVLVGLALALGS